MSAPHGTDPLRSTNRATRRRTWRTVFARALGGVTHERVAEALSVSRVYVEQALGLRAAVVADPMTGAALPVDDLPALLELGEDGERAFDQILEQLARLRGRVVRDDVPAAEDLGNDLHSLSELTGATGQVCAQLLAAIADLRLDRGESARLRPLVARAIALLNRWDAVLERVDREGVIAVRGIA